MTKKPTTTDPPARRGYADRRARRLVGNATLMLTLATLPTVAVISYRATASELGTVGWFLITVIAMFAAIAAACLWGASRLQAGVDRANAADTAVATFDDDQAVVVAAPVMEPTGVAAPVRPMAVGAFLPPDKRPIVASTGFPETTPAPTGFQPEGPAPRQTPTSPLNQ